MKCDEWVQMGRLTISEIWIIIEELLQRARLLQPRQEAADSTTHSATDSATHSAAESATHTATGATAARAAATGTPTAGTAASSLRAISPCLPSPALRRARLERIRRALVVYERGVTVGEHLGEADGHPRIQREEGGET